jgi:hypothetical protein
MIESSRKHGRFDSRYPHTPSRLTLVKGSAQQATGAEGADRLDWYAFSTGFYPGRQRHDFQVLEAYDAYRNASQAFELHGNGSQAYETHRREAERSKAARGSAALEAWEGEGGASNGPVAPAAEARSRSGSPR